MLEIITFVEQFRKAIEVAKNMGEFDTDFSFHKFPLGCCGDTCDLLAQYLLENNIRTYYVCGTYRGRSFNQIQSHAWLLTDNNMVIDITGDQFKSNSHFLNYDKRVYVGLVDDFHRLFKVENRNIHKNYGLDSLGNVCQLRLFDIYRKILKYI